MISMFTKGIQKIIIPAFFKEKKGIMCYRSPSVCPKGDYVLPSVRPSGRPAGSSLPASPPTLLMLESPNLYA